MSQITFDYFFFSLPERKGSPNSMFSGMNVTLQVWMRRGAEGQSTHEDG